MIEHNDIMPHNSKSTYSNWWVIIIFFFNISYTLAYNQPGNVRDHCVAGKGLNIKKKKKICRKHASEPYEKNKINK